MIDSIVSLLASIPPPLATIILATLPIGELRGALPIALLVYDLPVMAAVALAIIGNILPVYFLMIFFERITAFFRPRWPWFDRLITWLFDRTRRKLEKKVGRYGYWSLALFVAVPLPVTGAWTGTLAAFVFGFPKDKAFLAILSGLFVSAAIVTFITLGASVSWQAFTA